MIILTRCKGQQSTPRVFGGFHSHKESNTCIVTITMSNQNNSTLCIITGASRGLGKHIAVQFAKHFPATHFILLARNGNDLSDTKQSIAHVDASATVDIYSIDLGDLNNLKTNVDKVFEKVTFFWISI